jgi:hypothetical protein
MRSTAELIAELDKEATQHWYVAIAIGFDHTSVFVRPTDPDRLRCLNEAISAGGHPVGLIVADRVDKQVKVTGRIYPEHANVKEQAKDYMERLMSNVAKELEIKE